MHASILLQRNYIEINVIQDCIDQEPCPFSREAYTGIQKNESTNF